VKITITLKPSGAVDCRGGIHLPLPLVSVWGQLRDFPRFAAQDPFHHNPRVLDGFPRQGARIELSHRYFGITVRRTGRILVWREILGYSYSDLSRHGPRRGFPHVLSYRLESLGPGSTRLHIMVRGRWTATGVPRLLTRLYLRWVFTQILHRVRNEFLVYQLWRKRRHS
jgi:hypothetical protein